MSREISIESAPPIQVNWECDLATNALIWSDGVYALFGISRDEPLMRDMVVDRYLPESREKLNELRNQAIAEKSSFTFEAQFRRGDGEIRWMRVTADFDGGKGAAGTLYGTKLDITDEMTARGNLTALLAE